MLSIAPLLLASAVAAAVGAVVWLATYAYVLRRRLLAVASPGSLAARAEEANKGRDGDEITHVRVLYCSQTGRAKGFASTLQSFLPPTLSCEVVDMGESDPEDLLSLADGTLCVFVVSTYAEGLAADSGRWFLQWLQEAGDDFRIDRDALRHLRYAVFGNGNSLYHHHYNQAARDLHRCLRRLSASSICPMGQGDETDDPDGAFERWAQDVLSSSLLLPHAAVDAADAAETLFESESEGEDASTAGGQGDLEDLAGPAGRGSKTGGAPAQRPAPKEMVTPALRAALTKQGYRVVGSHSGVKMCRWTKSMLRGRGGCYKHTFYGIASHQCMETTPSLACANKCVFCWRHHTNPVGTQWRWRVDAPAAILDGALQRHLQMVRELRGVPGVKPERLQEALHPRHCALSLVGEPIMYPHINEFVGLLHARGISSFLVTNAQFPELIDALVPVTQLYVSVDASTKDALKAVDRPLFGDFWERFLGSLQSLRRKQQRTVYRLTLVKGYNVAECSEYAQLIRMGCPDFVEIKGVTYCGSTGANPLTMANVPYHREVVDFSRQILAFLRDGSDASAVQYDMACEHEHSCSVLIANRQRFFVDGQWHTWIDYDRFQQLARGDAPFTSVDYMAPTPAWALFQSRERGFDPLDVRHHRHESSKPVSQGC